MEDEARAILADWTDVRVEDLGPFWLVVGADPQGVRRSGCRPDPVSLAHDLAALGRAPVLVLAEPAFAYPFAPEPVSAAPATTETPADAAPDDASSPVEDEGGSFLDTLLEMDADGAHQFPGVMVGESRMGVMAADRTEELRALRLGEVTSHAEDLLERYFNDGAYLRWQQLWSMSLAAETNSHPALSHEESKELSRLGLLERWAAAVRAEQGRRVKMLRMMISQHDIREFNARAGWPKP